MNLHGIVAGVIGAVNPLIPICVQVSNGNTENPNGTVTPAYLDPVTVLGQVQPVSWRDIQMMEGLNLQGIRWKVYLNGHIDGLVRKSNKGGDLVTISVGPQTGTWLVALILEAWPDWTCAGITLQNP